MAILEQDLQAAHEHMDAGFQRHRFSRGDYRAMADAGILDDLRVELIEGDIFDMAPYGTSHAALTDIVAGKLREAFGTGFAVRSQVPIALGSDSKPSEPQPDIAVVVGTLRDYMGRKPVAADVRLLVEVADRSLKFDRGRKSALYATAGIPEYWIVNLVDNRLEVYREPAKSKYAVIIVYDLTDHVTPLFAPASFIAVRDCLP